MTALIATVKLVEDLVDRFTLDRAHIFKEGRDSVPFQ